DAVGDREPLAGALANFLRRKERIVNLVQVRGGDVATAVFDLDYGISAIAASADPDLALLVALLNLFDRMRRVHEQVQDDLVDLRREAAHGRQIRGEVELDVRDVLPFVTRDGHGARDPVVDIRALLVVAWVRELLHGRDDLLDPLHAERRL